MGETTPENELDEDIAVDEESADGVSGGRALPHNKKEAVERLDERAAERF